MRTKIILAGLFVCFLIGTTVFAQEPIVVYDPLRKAPEKSFTDGDEQLVITKIVPGIKTRWSDDSSCDGSSLTVIGAADGAFTKTAAAQRAVLYEMCQTGNGFANNGIAIVEEMEMSSQISLRRAAGTLISSVLPISTKTALTRSLSRRAAECIRGTQAEV